MKNSKNFRKWAEIVFIIHLDAFIPQVLQQIYIYQTVVVLLLWLHEWMASGRVTLALYLAIALESEDFNTTQTWVRMFLKHDMRF